MIASAALRKLFQIVIVLGIGYFAFHYFVDNRDALTYLTSLSLKNLTLIGLLLVANSVITALQQLIVVQNLGRSKIAFLGWLDVVLVSRFINQHMVQAGTFYRMVELKRRYNFSYLDTVGLLAFFTWFGIFVLLSVVLIFVFFSPLTDKQNNSYVLAVLGAMIAVLLLGPIFARKVVSKLNFKPGKISDILSRSAEIGQQLVSQLYRPQLVLIYTAMTISSFCLVVGASMSSFSAIGEGVDYQTGVVFALILLLTRTINVVPGNLGVTELICGFLADFLISSAAAGIVVSGLNRILNYLFLAFWTAGSRILVFSRKLSGS